MQKPPDDVVQAARRIWIGTTLPEDAGLVKAWLSSVFPKPPVRMDVSVRWVLTYAVADAPSRYKDIEAFVARHKHTEHLPLGGRWD